MRTIFFLLFTLPLNSQTVYESMMTFSRTYRPFLGKESATISIDLIREYSLTNPDTSRYVMIKINQQVAEQTGYSIGSSIFSTRYSWAAAFASSKTYLYQKDNGLIVMAYHEFIEFYNALNKTFTYINNEKTYKNTKTNRVVTYQYNDIVFGGEYVPSKPIPISFYMQIGDAVYSMDETAFIETAQQLRVMRLYWEKYMSP